MQVIKKNNFFNILSKISTIIVFFIQAIILLFLIQIIVFGSKITGMTGDILSQEKDWSRSFLYRSPGSPKLEDFLGYKEVKGQFQAVVDNVNSDKPKKKGILLHGPPGNGKTFLVKCFYGTLQEKDNNIPCYYISGSTFLSSYVGIASQRVRQLFKEATEYAKNLQTSHYVIFIDEIDVIAKKRNLNNGRNNNHDEVLNQLLTLLDGVDSDNDVGGPQPIVIGATNYKELLDEALIRDGRLGEHIFIGHPEIKDIQENLKMHLKGFFDKEDNKEFLKQFSKTLFTANFTSVKITELFKIFDDLSKKHSSATTDLTKLEGAPLEADKISKDSEITPTNNDIIKNQLWNALDELQSGPVREDLDPSQKECIYIHELGHAFFVNKQSGYEIARVSLRSRGFTGGYVSFYSKNADMLTAKKGMLQNISIALGGRMFEQIFNKNDEDVTIGASSDLQRVNDIAYSMILNYLSISNLKIKEKIQKIGKIQGIKNIKSKDLFNKDINDVISKICNNVDLEESKIDESLILPVLDSLGLSNIFVNNLHVDHNVKINEFLKKDVLRIIFYCYIDNLLLFLTSIDIEQSDKSDNPIQKIKRKYIEIIHEKEKLPESVDYTLIVKEFLNDKEFFKLKAEEPYYDSLTFP